MTPELVCGVWVGADNPSIHFRTTALGQGANMALPIFAEFWLRINADHRYRSVAEAYFDTLTSRRKRKHLIATHSRKK